MEDSRLLQVLLPIAIALIMTGIGMSLTPRDFRRIGERPKPVLVGVALTGMFWRTNTSKFAWRQPPYEYEHDKVPIDILAGSDTLRKQIESGMPAMEIAAGWKADEEAFRSLRERFLLY